MVNSSKILTVSYGTFSCTLEGFDDSFDTMKAIAEYFRDLAADDRYFGAEPPTPDADMLAKIAGREISRRVDAHDENGRIHLRASEAAVLPPAEAATPATERPAASPAPDAAEAAMDSTAQAPVEASGAGAGEITPPAAAAPAPKHRFEAESVADKLRRIRAVASPATSFDSGYTEDEHAQEFLSSAQSDIAAALDEDDARDTEADLQAQAEREAQAEHEAEAAREAEAEAEAAREVEAKRQAQAERDAEAERDAKAEREAKAARQAEAEAEAKAATDQAAQKDAEDRAAREAEAAAEAKKAADTEREAEAQAERDAQSERRMQADADADAEAEQARTEEAARQAGAARQAETAARAETEAGVDADMLARLSAATDATGTQALSDGSNAEDGPDAFNDDAAPEAEDTLAQLMADALGSDADSTQISEMAAPELRPLAARVIKMKRADMAAALGEATKTGESADTADLTTLPPEEEADLQRELAEVEAELNAARISNAPAQIEPETAKAAVQDAAGGVADTYVADTYSDGAPEDLREDTGTHVVEDIGEDTDADTDSDTPESLMEETREEDAQEAAPETAEADDNANTANAAEDEDSADAAESADDATLDTARNDDEGTPVDGKATMLGTVGTDAQTARFFDEADTQLQEPESNERRRAIQHLRAAVAATKAERNAGGAMDAGVDDQPYRLDLENAVRPRRPHSAGAATPRPERPGPQRPAPLKLVAAQRIDTDVAPVKPRRVVRARPAEAAQTDAAGPRSDAEAYPETSTQHNRETGDSFAEFAGAQGAKSLPELLEAAAAYMADVEGMPQFSRPMLMQKLREMEAGEFSREEGLRSFGQLLRQGKLQKLKGGRFAVTDETDFRRAG